MLLLTSDWPHYHCRLGILFAGLNIHPSAPASSCTPSAPLYADFLSLLADPLRFEDPSPGFQVAERTRRWLDMLAATACFQRSMCPAHSLTTPTESPAHSCSTPCTTDTATTLDSMDGPPASVASVLMLSPLSRFLGPAFPVVVPGCHVLLTRSAMMRLQVLVCLSPPPLSLLPVLLLPHLLTTMMKFLFRTAHAVLLSFCVVVMLQFLSRAPVFLAFPLPPPL
jgi:hypothetical protein